MAEQTCSHCGSRMAHFLNPERWECPTPGRHVAQQNMAKGGKQTGTSNKGRKNDKSKGNLRRDKKR